jgi:hypothetical protein
MTDNLLQAAKRLAEQLSPAEQAALMQHLQHLRGAATGEAGGVPVTLEAILAEHQRRLDAGLFERAEDVRGKFNRPGMDYEQVSFEELQEAIRAASNEWEEELDEFFGDD